MLIRRLLFLLFYLAGGRWRCDYRIDHEPEAGRPSQKARRLVEFCLGEVAVGPVPNLKIYRRYLRRPFVLLLTVGRGEISVIAGDWVAGRMSRARYDQKKIVAALIDQRACIPSGLNCWMIRGDSAGSKADTRNGLHIAGVRSWCRRDIVLVPTANRERVLGPNLERQMHEIRQFWVLWEDKSDSVWWGGALTGDRWKTEAPRTLTRREVLCHFRENPCDRVNIQLTDVPASSDAPLGIEPGTGFTKREAFSHKCLLLLPGNDVPSGLSWYFAGNSVVLMPRPHLDHILYFELQPWEHYVPVDNDPRDILVKLQWVMENQARARKIVENSHERLRWFCGPEYLWACNEVLRRISPAEPLAGARRE